MFYNRSLSTKASYLLWPANACAQFLCLSFKSSLISSCFTTKFLCTFTLHYSLSVCSQMIPDCILYGCHFRGTETANGKGRRDLQCLRTTASDLWTAVSESTTTAYSSCTNQGTALRHHQNPQWAAVGLFYLLHYS